MQSDLTQNDNMTDDELIEKLMLADADEIKEIRQTALIVAINDAFAERERPLIPAGLKG